MAVTFTPLREGKASRLTATGPYVRQMYLVKGFTVVDAADATRRGPEVAAQELETHLGGYGAAYVGHPDYATALLSRIQTQRIHRLQPPDDTAAIVLAEWNTRSVRIGAYTYRRTGWDPTDIRRPFVRYDKVVIGGITAWFSTHESDEHYPRWRFVRSEWRLTATETSSLITTIKANLNTTFSLDSEDMILAGASIQDAGGNQRAVTYQFVNYNEVASVAAGSIGDAAYPALGTLEDYDFKLPIALTGSTSYTVGVKPIRSFTTGGVLSSLPGMS